MHSEPSVPLSINDWREELQKERKKSEDLQNNLKNQERNYQKLVGELKTQLQAEQQKSLSLENSLQKAPYTMNQIIDLQSQLKQAEFRQKALIEEHNHKIHDLELQCKEAQSNNLSVELSQFKDFAISEITSKEKLVIEQKLIIEKSEDTITSLSQEIEYAQSLLLSEKQKYLSQIEDLGDRVEELEEELRQVIHYKEENRVHQNWHHDEVSNNAKARDENSALKLQIESLQEELELRSQDLKNSEKKISQLRETRQSLADTIRNLEVDIESLQREKTEILKGLENKEETIHLLEEEIHSNAEGLSEYYKEELSKANDKCKRLERILKDVEEEHENKLEEKMTENSQLQIKINDLNRKLHLFEREKEHYQEKLQKSNEELAKLEEKIFELSNQKDKNNENVKEKLKDKIVRLKTERDELRIRLTEFQESSGFNRPSVIEPGGSLFDELAQLPEGRFSRISIRSTVVEDNKRLDGLIAQVAEKETTLKNLTTEKNYLEIRMKESLTEIKNLQMQVSTAVKHSQNLAKELEITKWELDSLREDESAKLDKGKILVLESEKELLLAEKSRLETELVLSKENWAELNNSLYKDLLECQTTAAQSKSELLMLKEGLSLAKSEMEDRSHQKKRSIGSWFGKKK